MKNPEFLTGEFYHIYNRGVEKRTIFTTDADRYRFLRSLYFCNDTAPAENSFRKPDTKDTLTQLCETPSQTVIRRKTLVKIHAFILMPNHFHMLLEQRVNEGIKRFMHKLGVAYSMYFNIRHKRVGPLFQGVFKSVLVNEESQLDYLPYYIHANALDFLDKKWREGKLESSKDAVDYLNNYKWSSHQDYAGVVNYPSLIDMKFLKVILGQPNEYKKNLKEWLEDQAEEDCSTIEFE